jgi:hypothetical protein
MVAGHGVALLWERAGLAVGGRGQRVRGRGVRGGEQRRICCQGYGVALIVRRGCIAGMAPSVCGQLRLHAVRHADRGYGRWSVGNQGVRVILGVRAGRTKSGRKGMCREERYIQTKKKTKDRRREYWVREGEKEKERHTERES